MRSRTELVTTQLEGSDFDEESDFEDSEEDWQPSKGDQKPKKIKSSSRGKKATGGNKNGAKNRSRKANKTSKRSSENDASETESTSKKKSRKTSNTQSGTSSSKNNGQVLTSDMEPTTSMVSTSMSSVKPQPLQRKIVTPLKSFPDKCGYLNLFIFKGDLKDGIVNNSQVCLWRRDGSSLLQKYLRDRSVSSNVPQYNSSMVYSCWEDRRSDEYLEVKVRCLEQAKQIRVELTDIEELEAKSKNEYEKYVAAYGTPVPRSNKRKETNCSNDIANDGTGCDDDDDDDEECDEDMDEAGDDGEIEYEEEEVEEEEGEIIPQEE